MKDRAKSRLSITEMVDRSKEPLIVQHEPVDRSKRTVDWFGLDPIDNL